ncbi:MAG: sulfotransferase domain-containing protein [Hyphomonadaceae bacterium]
MTTDAGALFEPALVELRSRHEELAKSFADLVAERDYLRIDLREREAALLALRARLDDLFARFELSEQERGRLDVRAREQQAELAALRAGHSDLTQRFSGIVAERDFLRTELAQRNGAHDAAEEHYRRQSERGQTLEQDRRTALLGIEKRLGVKVAKGDPGVAVDVLIPTKSGRELCITVPTAPLAQAPSSYFFAYAKSGSVLLDSLIRDIVAAGGAPSFNLSEQLFAQGHSTKDARFAWKSLFAERGVVHYGFRNYPPYELPIRDENPLVLLVRDPRDMLVSMYFSAAKSHGLPAQGPHRGELERAREEASLLSVDEYCLAHINDYLVAFEHNRRHGLDRAMVFRYEEIIFKKRDFVANLSQIMGVSLYPEEVDRIAQAHDLIPAQEDVNAHIRNVHPGDHRNKLRPSTIDALNEAFVGFMSAYGYEIEGNASGDDVQLARLAEG